MTRPTAPDAELLADWRWLLGPDASRWIAEVAHADCTAVQLATRLRRELSARRTHLVLQQAELRAKGAEKFSAAGRMFFTPLGLEQATDEIIANCKAERFPLEVPLADLCCGVGGDLLALAGRGPVLGVDRDPIMALVAEANARFVLNDGDAGASNRVMLRTDDVRSLDLSPFAAWHIDPDRRSGGRRSTRVKLHEPPPEEIERLLSTCPHGAVKLAPAAELPDGWCERAELEWFSSRRECRQLVAWFGALAIRPGMRRATILGRTLEARRPVIGDPDAPISPIGPIRPMAQRTIIGEPNLPLTAASGVDRYVFEPDPAVSAAHLTGALAAEHGLHAIAPRAAYLTGPAPLDDPALASFEVLEVLPLRTGPLKRWLAERRMGRLEVKKRGVEIDPGELQRQLAVPGEEQATLLATRVGQRAIAIMARRTANVESSRDTRGF